jgi:hypothetical protein
MRVCFVEVEFILLSRYRYEGSIREAKRHGTGVMLYADGCVFGGKWQVRSYMAFTELKFSTINHRTTLKPTAYSSTAATIGRVANGMGLSRCRQWPR